MRSVRLRWRSWGTLAMAGVLLLYALLSVERSKVKPLWFDELSTLNVTTQPTLAAMFRVEPPDASPPLQYLLLRPCLHVFGVNALALRLPAMCFVGLALLCAYLFVGRRYGAAAGLVTATLLLFSHMSDYGVEARPYGLVIGLTGLLLVFWQHAAEGGPRRTGALVGVAATVFALTIAHSMGVVWAAVPLLAGETCRWWRANRTVDRDMLVAILAGMLGFGITLRMGHATQRALSFDAGQSHSSIALPTPGKFAQAWQVEGLLPAFALLAALLAILLATAWWQRLATQASGRPARDLAEQSGAPMHEWAAAGAVALTMVAVYLLACVVTHYFWARYIIPAALGWFVLVGMLCGHLGDQLGSRFGRRRTAAFVLAGGLCLLWMERRGMVKTTAAPKAASQDSVVPTVLRAGDPNLPIVIGKPFFYPQVWWYSDPTMRQRLHYIADAGQAAHTSDFIPELALIEMHRAGSALFPPDGLTPFLARNKRFLLWHHYTVQGTWLEDYLREKGYSFRPVASSASGDETLFEVTAP